MYVQNTQTNSNLTFSYKVSYTGSFFMTPKNYIYIYKILWFSIWEWESKSTGNVSVKA